MCNAYTFIIGKFLELMKTLNGFKKSDKNAFQLQEETDLSGIRGYSSSLLNMQGTSIVYHFDK